jgi:hypothetical protein
MWKEEVNSVGIDINVSDIDTKFHLDSYPYL